MCYTVIVSRRREGTCLNVQGYQRVTLLDYPEKVACTVFTGGCNLRCPFCHNATLVRAPLTSPSIEAEVLDYLQNGNIVKAAQYGNVVGAITVSRAGASTSIPSEAEVAEFIKQNDIAFA